MTTAGVTTAEGTGVATGAMTRATRMTRTTAAGERRRPGQCHGAGDSKCAVISDIPAPGGGGG